jgi:DNA-binding beta-propeller fold protein YncE
LIATNDGAFFVTYKGVRPGDSCVMHFMSSKDSQAENSTEILKNPYGIAMDEDENIYVTDRGMHQLYKFNKKLQPLCRIGSGSPGRYGDEFCYPHGVSCINGLVYVCDNGSGRVKAYDHDLKLRYCFGDRLKEEPFEKQTLFGPTAIAVDSKNRLYVTDNKKMAVVKFQAMREDQPIFIQNMGKRNLRLPSEIAIDGDDHIFVSDRLKKCIVVFHASGNWVTDIGMQILQFPRGIACSVQGPALYLYVAEYNKDALVNVWKLEIEYK